MCTLIDSPIIMKFFLAIDVETSGQCLKRNFMPCLGAALIEVSSCTEKSRFLTYIQQPEDSEWEQRALDEFWLKPENIAHHHEILKILKSSETPTREAAMAAFLSWVRSVCDQYGAENITCISDTAGFDYSWLSRYLPDGLSPNYLFGSYQPWRDVSSFHMGIAHTTPSMSLWGAEERAFKALGVPTPTLDVVHDHRPDNDAAVIGLMAAHVAREVEKRVVSDC